MRNLKYRGHVALGSKVDSLGTLLSADSVLDAMANLKTKTG